MKFQSMTMLTLCLALIPATGCEQEPATPSSQQTMTTEAAALSLPEIPEYDSLHDLMEEVSDHFKFLRRHTESGEAGELLQHSVMIRALVTQARTLTPEPVEKAEGAEREKLSQAFQTHLDAVAPALDAFDAAIQADDRAAAVKAVQQLHEAEERGHEALGVEEH